MAKNKTTPRKGRKPIQKQTTKTNPKNILQNKTQQKEKEETEKKRFFQPKKANADNKNMPVVTPRRNVRTTESIQDSHPSTTPDQQKHDDDLERQAVRKPAPPKTKNAQQLHDQATKEFGTHFMDQMRIARKLELHTAAQKAWKDRSEDSSSEQSDEVVVEKIIQHPLHPISYNNRKRKKKKKRLVTENHRQRRETRQKKTRKLSTRFRTIS